MQIREFELGFWSRRPVSAVKRRSLSTVHQVRGTIWARFWCHKSRTVLLVQAAAGNMTDLASFYFPNFLIPALSCLVAFCDGDMRNWRCFTYRPDDSRQQCCDLSEWRVRPVFITLWRLWPQICRQKHTRTNVLTLNWHAGCFTKHHKQAQTLTESPSMRQARISSNLKF